MSAQKLRGRLRRPRIHAVDLFCGVGGLTHGLVRGGVQVKAGIDVDPSCRFAYEQNNSADFLERDIESVQAADIERYFSDGDVSLLAGCAPCQPFSTYSRRGRSDRADSQWPLVLAFGRLIEQVKPDLVAGVNYLGRSATTILAGGGGEVC